MLVLLFALPALADEGRFYFSGDGTLRMANAHFAGDAGRPLPRRRRALRRGGHGDDRALLPLAHRWAQRAHVAAADRAARLRRGPLPAAPADPGLGLPQPGVQPGAPRRRPSGRAGLDAHRGHGGRRATRRSRSAPAVEHSCVASSSAASASTSRRGSSTSTPASRASGKPRRRRSSRTWRRRTRVSSRAPTSTATIRSTARSSVCIRSRRCRSPCASAGDASATRRSRSHRAMPRCARDGDCWIFAEPADRYELTVTGDGRAADAAAADHPRDVPAADRRHSGRDRHESHRTAGGERLLGRFCQIRVGFTRR